MLEKLFKSKTTVGLLSLLLFGKPMHIRGIARRIEITPIYVKKELEVLQKLGLVSNARIGNLSIWEINKRSPIYEEMKHIFLKTECLGDYLESAFKKSEIEFALIYGSFAKGTESENSDLDLLIIGTVDHKKLVSEITRIERKINREVNFIAWKKEEFQKNAMERHHLLINIAKNPVIMVKGDEDEFRKLVE